MARGPYKKIVHKVSSIRQLPPSKPRTRTASNKPLVFSSLYVVLTPYFLRAMRGSQEPGYTRVGYLSTYV